MPVKHVTMLTMLQKRIKAADTEIPTRFFYNSGCKNVKKLHDTLSRKSGNRERYVQRCGNINVIVKHKEGKSRTSFVKRDVSTQINTTNRFMPLQSNIESSDISLIHVGDNFEKKT